MKYFDLTMPLENRTPVYPGEPRPEIRQVATIENEGWNEKSLKFNSHFSTHIDAPFHMIKTGKTLNDYSIGHFVGQAIVLDVRGQSIIERAELSEIKKGDIVFLYTAQTDKAYSEAFFKNNPVISESFAKQLIEKKVKIVGLDSYTPDNPPFRVHKLLFAKDILIVENLIGLKPLIGKHFECFIFPLKIQAADGATCRVVARIP